MGKVILIVLAVLLSQPTAANRMVPIETAPETIPDVEKVMKSMERSDQGHTLRFRVPQDCATHEFFLEPYNGIHFSRYAVYLHLKEK